VPELPEVETIVRDLAQRLEGRTLKDPKLHKTDVLRRVSKRRLLNSLDGQRVKAVSRRAKHAVVLLQNGLRLVIQPRMTGRLMVYDRPPDEAESRHVVLEARVGRRGRFLYHDVRRLGTIWLLKDREWKAYTARIGPEPLESEFDVDAFTERLRGSRQAIKKVLMDQTRLAGVGNIYANEALFRARVDPSRRTDRLDHDSIARLHRETTAVLTEAIEFEGTTFRDYRTGTGEEGSFQKLLKAYGRGGLPCVNCGTLLTTTHAIDGRATTFCWRCQGSAG
jgi:formamidopyrimidine-DNA glycosylase